MPSVIETSKTLFYGLIALFIIGIAIFVGVYAIGGVTGPFMSELISESPNGDKFTDMVGLGWNAWKIVAAAAILIVFAYILFKLFYEREAVPEGGY